ncbi:MAG: histidine phosphatase family protein [bacterium]|nr:histidine phosphatase family protein [bacterium]
MAIYLLRHGESEGNFLKVNQGRIDLPLTARGREQAATAGRWLAGLGIEPEVIYASPLRRAWETAEIIIQQLKEGMGPSPNPGAMSFSMHEEPDVIEYHAGHAEGLSEEEMVARFPSYEHRTLDERGCWAEFGGESYEDVQTRLQRFIERVGREHSGAGLQTRDGEPGAPPRSKDVICVSHGGSLYQLLKLWCGWPAPRHYFTRIGNCTCFKLQLREISGYLGAELQFMVPIELMY